MFSGLQSPFLGSRYDLASVYGSKSKNLCALKDLAEYQVQDWLSEFTHRQNQSSLSNPESPTVDIT